MKKIRTQCSVDDLVVKKEKKEKGKGKGKGGLQLGYTNISLQFSTWESDAKRQKMVVQQ
jgi:hypothetical protein